jgi:glutamate-1-semialdehyde aminotransferase
MADETSPNPFRFGSRDYDLNPFIHPSVLRQGYDGHVIDDKGIDYIDFLSAWGANILGYGYRPVVRAAARQAKRFFGLGLPFPEFYELMALLGGIIPCAESIRFGKNGSDVTAVAVRLARAVTNREKVVFRGFHGFHDWYMASTECRGIPAGLRSLIVPLGELSPAAVDETLSQHRGEVACLIVNPLVPPIPNASDVQDVIETAHRHGTLVVFDEMISGFRVALAGMQEVWGVEPDLACYGKAIANGMPLSVLAGKASYMNALPAINYGITFEGEAVSIAAALKTIAEIKDRGVIAALALMGRRIKEDFARAASEFGIAAVTAGPDASPGFWFADTPGVSARELHWLFIQELTKDRIFTLGSFNLCYRHTRSDLDRLDRSFRRSFGVLRQCVDRRSARDLLDERVMAAMGCVQTPEGWRGLGAEAIGDRREPGEILRP